jgi:hypothetical protein
MCIIVVKPQGIDLPSKDVLKACFSANKDGAGYMYCKSPKRDTVTICKGFMTPETLLAQLDLSRIDKETACVLHFRRATHGAVSPGNCHPFPIAETEDLLKHCHLSGLRYGLAHNGILSFYNSSLKFDLRSELSDTQQLIQQLKPFPLSIDQLKAMITDKAGEFSKALGAGKMAILDSFGKIEMIGDGWHQKDGVFYSNTSFSAYLGGPEGGNYSLTPKKDMITSLIPYKCPKCESADIALRVNFRIAACMSKTCEHKWNY